MPLEQNIDGGPTPYRIRRYTKPYFHHLLLLLGHVAVYLQRCRARADRPPSKPHSAGSGDSMSADVSQGQAHDRRERDDAAVDEILQRRALLQRHLNRRRHVRLHDRLLPSPRPRRPPSGCPCPAGRSASDAAYSRDRMSAGFASAFIMCPHRGCDGRRVSKHPRRPSSPPSPSARPRTAHLQDAALAQVVRRRPSASETACPPTMPESGSRRSRGMMPLSTRSSTERELASLTTARSPSRPPPSAPRPRRMPLSCRSLSGTLLR